MTDLKVLKEAAQDYMDRELDENGFHEVILSFLEDATPDDYAAFAMWLVEQGKGH